MAKTDTKVYGGFHGYDPQMDEMRAFFMARGPSVKPLGQLEIPAQSLDFYPLLAELLGISPLPNNGTNSLVETINIR